MSEQRLKMIAAVRFILGIIIDKKLDEVPLMLRGMLKGVNAESLTAMLEGELSEEDWVKIEALLI